MDVLLWIQNVLIEILLNLSKDLYKAKTDNNLNNYVCFYYFGIIMVEVLYENFNNRSKILREIT